MSLIYIPPGYIWLIEAAVVIAERCKPDIWAADMMLPNEREFWDGIITGRYKSEFVSLLLTQRYPEIDWSTPSIETCRYHVYDQALQILRMLISEGYLKANFIDDEAGGKIDHIRGETLRTKAGVDVICRGYAYLEGNPTKPYDLFVSEADLMDRLKIMGILKEDPRPPSANVNEGSASDQGRSTQIATQALEETSSTLARGISAAVAALFPAGNHDKLLKKERDRKIVRWMRDNGYPIPSERSLRRFFNQ